MPEALRRRTLEEEDSDGAARTFGEPRERRNLAFPIALVAGLVIAVVAGFALGGGGGDETPPPETPGEPVAAESGSLAMQMPAGYAALDEVPELSGLALEDAAAYAPGGRPDGRAIVFGQVGRRRTRRCCRSRSASRPASIRPRCPSAPPSRSGTACRPTATRAWRSRARIASPPSTRRPPPRAWRPSRASPRPRTPKPSRASARRPRTRCSSRRGSPSRSAPTPRTRSCSARTFGKLDADVAKGRRALGRNGATFRAQAAAARDIQAAYAAAARKLRAADTSPADVAINAALAKSLTNVSAAWKKAASEAAAKDTAGFARSEAAIKAAQRELAQTVKGLEVGGYTVDS